MTGMQPGAFSVSFVHTYVQYMVSRARQRGSKTRIVENARRKGGRKGLLACGVMAFFFRLSSHKVLLPLRASYV